jgi:hypothetical protein
VFVKKAEIRSVFPLCQCRRGETLSQKEEAKGAKMDTLHSVVHLQREIGDEAFNALVSSDNTEAVRQFAQELVEKSLPTKMTVGGRTYEILCFLKGDEKSVIDHVMVDRAKEMNANLGQDDGEHILKHQDEIPVALRGKVAFVFTDWRLPDGSGDACGVYWNDDRWVRGWGWLDDDDWSGDGRLLRRK